MSDIGEQTLVQAPIGAGKRETSSIIMRMRILTRCRELMMAGVFRPTLKQLANEKISNKALRYHFDDISALHREALDDHDTRIGWLRALMPDGQWPSDGDCGRLINTIVFREPLL